MTNLKVTKLFIYPIKGLGGMAVDSAELLDEGFRLDRRWMLVDNRGVFLSQRTDTKLALFRTEISNDGILVTYGDETIIVPYQKDENKLTEVSVWKQTVSAAVLPTDINYWFSNILDMDVRLVRYTPSTRRRKEFDKSPYSTPVSFADGYPLLIIGQASLDHLNGKLEIPLGFDRFRPNIVVSTKEPHEEDNWEDVIIGNVRLKIIKPCSRCVVTTINQESGEKGREPLLTLSKYRKKDRAINFGVNAMVVDDGVLNTGDLLRVESYG